MSEPLTQEQPPARFMIPRHFSYTRFNNENVEVVLATDYDALQAKLQKVERARDANFQVMKDLNEDIAKLEQQLATCHEHLEAQRQETYRAVEREQALKQQLQTVTQERDALRQAGQP